MVAPLLDAELTDLVEQTLSEALAWLREHPPEGPVLSFCVVDAVDRLQGVLPTRRLPGAPGSGEVFVDCRG